MKFRFFLLFSLLIFSLIAMAPKAKAQEVDHVAAAISALQTSNVYVAPGTPGTDYNTPAELSVFLTPELNVVLVMLPSDALNGTDLFTIAQRISAGLNNEKTIGLSVGNTLMGYSLRLPEGVASELMVRADSTSNNTSTALVSFSRNIQLWLISNPQPIPTATPEPTPTPRPTMTPIELPKASEVSGTAWALCGSVLLILIVVIILNTRKVIDNSKKNARRQQRVDSLEAMRQLIERIETSVSEISNKRIRTDLNNAIMLAYGLIEIFQESEQYIGITESLAPELITNMGKQVKAYLRHESGRRPVPENLLSDLVAALLNYDALFRKLQENDPDGVELLASVIHSKTTMISQLGYLEDEN